jgi:chromosome segregation ATPase
METNPEKKQSDVSENEMPNNVLITYENVEQLNENSLKGFLLTTEQMADVAINQMILQTIESDEALNQKIESYNALMIKGIEDMVSYKMVDAAIKDLKKLRTSIAKSRLELTRPADAYREKLIEAERSRVEKLKTLEAKLIADKQKIDDAIKAKREATFIERSQKLHEVGYTIQNNLFVLGAFHIPSDQLSDMNEDEFERYMEHGRDEMKRREAEAQAIKEAKEQAEKQAQLLEQERLQLQQQREQMAAEMEAMRQERAKMAQEMEDLRLQKQALEETYTKVEAEVVAENVVPTENFETPEQKNIKSFSEKMADLKAQGKELSDTVVKTETTVETQTPTQTETTGVTQTEAQLVNSAPTPTQPETKIDTVLQSSIPTPQAQTSTTSKPIDKTSISYTIGFNAVKSSILEAFKNPEFKSRVNLIAGAKDSLEQSIHILNSATSRVELFKAIEAMMPITEVHNELPNG